MQSLIESGKGFRVNMSLTVIVLSRQRLIFIRKLVSVLWKVLERKNVTYSRCTFKCLLFMQHPISTNVASTYYECLKMSDIIIFQGKPPPPSFLIFAEETSSARDASFSLVSSLVTLTVFLLWNIGLCGEKSGTAFGA